MQPSQNLSNVVTSPTCKNNKTCVWWKVPAGKGVDRCLLCLLLCLIICLMINVMSYMFSVMFYMFIVMSYMFNVVSYVYCY